MASPALLETLRIMLQRELATVRRSIEAYPDDKSIWGVRPGLPNTAGISSITLARCSARPDMFATAIWSSRGATCRERSCWPASTLRKSPSMPE
jgi:hypothetical protein